MSHRQQPFASFAVGTLTDVRAGDGVRHYLERIDQTLRPFGGRFLIHGGNPRPVEGGPAPYDLIVIGFPEPDAARSWYESADYQALAPIRQGFSQGRVVIYDGEDDEHQATDILQR